jgi:hypothetical protein
MAGGLFLDLASKHTPSDELDKGLVNNPDRHLGGAGTAI